MQSPVIVPLIRVSSVEPPKPNLSSPDIVQTPLAEPSPTLTLQVAPKARARTKLEEITKSGSGSKHAVSQAKRCPDKEEPNVARRERRNALAFGRGFIAGKGQYW